MRQHGRSISQVRAKRDECRSHEKVHKKTAARNLLFPPPQNKSTPSLRSCLKKRGGDLQTTTKAVDCRSFRAPPPELLTSSDNLTQLHFNRLRPTQTKRAQVALRMLVHLELFRQPRRATRLSEHQDLLGGEEFTKFLLTTKSTFCEAEQNCQATTRKLFLLSLSYRDFLFPSCNSQSMSLPVNPTCLVHKNAVSPLRIIPTMSIPDTPHDSFDLNQLNGPTYY